MLLDRQGSTLLTWRWGRSTAILSLDSTSGIMLDPVFLSGVYDQNGDDNDRLILSKTISNIPYVCLNNLSSMKDINCNNHGYYQGGWRSGS